jgi:hypothetical protein
VCKEFSFSKRLEIVEKPRRSKPSNSLEDKCREAAIESQREASQIGEQVNESRGETLPHFAESLKEERMVEILEEISRSFEDRWILRRCKEVTARTSEGLKLRRSITVDPGHRSVRSTCDIVYRGFTS